MHMWRTFMCPMSIENCSVVNVKWRLNRIIHRNGVGSDSSIDYTIVKYAVCTLYSDRQCSNFSLLLHLFIITKQILFIIIHWPTATTTKPSRKKTLTDRYEQRTWKTKSFSRCLLVMGARFSIRYCCMKRKIWQQSQSQSIQITTSR